MKKFLVIIFVIISGIADAQPREKMVYGLRYGFVRGGVGYLTAKDTIYNSQPAVHHFMNAKTVGIADKLFKVDDVYESFVDPETYLPIMAIRNVKERNYRYYNEVTFDHVHDSIYSQRSGVKKVPDNLVDILGLFFYMRQNNFLNNLDTDTLYTIPMFHADEYFMMKVKYLGKEILKTRLGDKECYVVSPRVKAGKILKRADGLKFYITTDDSRLPIYMEFEMKIGSLKCELLSYKIKGNEQIVGAEEY